MTRRTPSVTGSTSIRMSSIICRSQRSCTRPLMARGLNGTADLDTEIEEDGLLGERLRALDPHILDRLTRKRLGPDLSGLNQANQAEQSPGQPRSGPLRRRDRQVWSHNAFGFTSLLWRLQEGSANSQFICNLLADAAGQRLVDSRIRGRAPYGSADAVRFGRRLPKPRSARWARRAC